MCVNLDDVCDVFGSDICSVASEAKYACCTCGGGKDEFMRNMTYAEHIGSKTIVLIGGSHYSGTSVLQVRHPTVAGIVRMHAYVPTVS